MQDVAFLAHEPLLDKFREQKAFLKKIRRAVGRHEKKVAMRLDKRRPVYRLDHLIRERYPTFDDALRDVDDALCLIHLFASISSSRLVPPQRVHKCLQLAREWQSYVARTHSLRKVFISIKGFYYQAEINGVTVTWVVPHTFAQQPTMQVDYRVMLSFLELYETLLSFVNFKCAPYAASVSSGSHPSMRISSSCTQPERPHAAARRSLSCFPSEGVPIACTGSSTRLTCSTRRPSTSSGTPQVRISQR